MFYASIMLPRLLISVTLLVILSYARNQVLAATLRPVLSTVGEQADLSSFWSLLLETGGDSGKPGREFEERFNIPSDLAYTVLAPTNDAFSKVPSSIIKALTSIPSYPLLATILRTHIVLGNLTVQEIVSPANSTQSVEGFMLSFDKDGSIAINKNSTISGVTAEDPAHLLKDNAGDIIRTAASNGAVFKIDRVLDPFPSYFGVDAPTTRLPRTTYQAGTMADVLRTNENLTSLHSTLEVVHPDFLTRLSLYSLAPTFDTTTVFLAPSNAAFMTMPAGASVDVMEPANAIMDGVLLEIGLGHYDGAAKMIKSTDGFNVTVTGGNVGNSKVEERICAWNGCVWLIGRWLDPLYGVF